MIIPTIIELEQTIREDLESSLGVMAVFQKKAINAFATVQAGKLHLYYKAVAQVQKNIFPDTADSELVGGTLERFGRVKLERNPFPATQGVYILFVQGSDGGTIPRGATYRKGVGDSLYMVENEVVLSGALNFAQVRALDAGRDSILYENDIVTLTSPIPNVNSGADVQTVVSEPQNAETIEQYRRAVLQAYVTEPTGGSAADYRIWASDANGVVRVYPFVGSQAGIINIYVEANTTDGVPTQTILDDVAGVIEFDPDTSKPLAERGRRPISAWQINYLPIVPLGVKVIIYNLSDNSSGVIDDIAEALIEFLKTIRPYVGGADDPNNIKDTLRISDVNSVILNAIGTNNFFSSIELEVDGNQVNEYRFTGGNVPRLSSIETPV